MYDKLDLQIDFHPDFVTDTSRDGVRSGFINFELYDFSCVASVAYVHSYSDDENQDILSTEAIYSDCKARNWDSISSGHSDIAVGFFPTGNGEYRWPHVRVKCSPAKILQGHNVFGSEYLTEGAHQMISNLMQAFPKIARHLDIVNAFICYLDNTYSARITSEFFQRQLYKFFELCFPNKENITKRAGYLQANRSSEYHRHKLYNKIQELLMQIDIAKRTNQKERHAVLSDPLLVDFATGLQRFEGTTGKRALINMGIPIKLTEFLKFEEWFERVHDQPLSQYLWHKSFDKIFAQLGGHTMKNVDDDTIKLKIDAKYITTKNGRVNKRKANSIFQTYRNIKLDGYDQLARENRSSFFENVKSLMTIGLSKAFLKSLDPNKPKDNVVPLISFIEIDFSQQRPDWYEEPIAGYSDSRRHLRLVG